VEALEQAVREVDSGRGVLILTDLFGGTPANISMPLIGPKVEVVCGMNLPMLIKFAGCRSTHSLAEAAALLQEYGRRHISLASQFLPRAGKRS
jgi:PTS system mannose-specific IIA component